jgi:hypothetical protein
VCGSGQWKRHGKEKKAEVEMANEEDKGRNIMKNKKTKVRRIRQTKKRDEKRKMGGRRQEEKRNNDATVFRSPMKHITSSKSISF